MQRAITILIGGATLALVSCASLKPAASDEKRASHAFLYSESADDSVKGSAHFVSTPGHDPHLRISRTENKEVILERDVVLTAAQAEEITEAFSKAQWTRWEKRYGAYSRRTHYWSHVVFGAGTWREAEGYAAFPKAGRPDVETGAFADSGLKFIYDAVDGVAGQEVLPRK